VRERPQTNVEPWRLGQAQAVIRVLYYGGFHLSVRPKWTRRRVPNGLSALTPLSPGGRGGVGMSSTDVGPPLAL
jgi:hypothetical protein